MSCAARKSRILRLPFRCFAIFRLLQKRRIPHPGFRPGAIAPVFPRVEDSSVEGLPGTAKTETDLAHAENLPKTLFAFLCAASAWIGFAFEPFVRAVLLADVEPGFVLITQWGAHHRAQYQNDPRGNQYRSYDHAPFAASRMPKRNCWNLAGFLGWRVSRFGIRRVPDTAPGSVLEPASPIGWQRAGRGLTPSPEPAFSPRDCPPPWF